MNVLSAIEIGIQAVTPIQNNTVDITPLKSAKNSWKSLDLRPPHDGKRFNNASHLFNCPTVDIILAFVCFVFLIFMLFVFVQSSSCGLLLCTLRQGRSCVVYKSSLPQISNRPDKGDNTPFPAPNYLTTNGTTNTIQWSSTLNDILIKYFRPFSWL